MPKQPQDTGQSASGTDAVRRRPSAFELLRAGPAEATTGAAAVTTAAALARAGGARMAGGASGRASATTVRALQRAVGNRAAQRALAAAEPARPAARETAMSGGIQRLMSLGRFQDLSGSLLSGPRVKVATIDDAVDAFHTFRRTYNRTQHMAALGHVRDLCDWYLALPHNTTNARRRAGVTALRQDAANEHQRVLTHPVDWVNVNATFRTSNNRYTPEAVQLDGPQQVWDYRDGKAVEELQVVTVDEDLYRIEGLRMTFVATRALMNQLTSDSQYTVTAAGYERFAPVNLVEYPNQTHFREDRHFCYVGSDSAAAAALLRTPEARIFVVALNGDDLTFVIAGRRYQAHLTPRAGDAPCDFDYDADDGSVARKHVGHALYALG